MTCFLEFFCYIIIHYCEFEFFFCIFAFKNNYAMTERRYPIGIQTFSEMIRGGYVYVDKTDLMWQLAHYAKYIFNS